MGIENEEVEPKAAEFVPANAWDAWMLQAVKSVVRARFMSRLMRYAAWAAAGLGALGVVSIYWYFFRQNSEFDESKFDVFLRASFSAAGIGIAACTAVAVLLGGSALVDLYTQRLDLAIIEADDEGDIE